MFYRRTHSDETVRRLVRIFRRRPVLPDAVRIIRLIREGRRQGRWVRFGKGFRERERNGSVPTKTPSEREGLLRAAKLVKGRKKSNWTTSLNIGTLKSCCTQFSSFQGGNRHNGHPQDYSDDMDETHGGRRTLKKENGERNGGEGVRGRNASSGTGSTELI